MSDKFQDKYRIPSSRLPNWDYGCNAMYFVTICTAHRECYFGNITDGKMELSEIGEIAHRYWTEIPNHFPFVELGEFVVMPNHVHGIIIIDKPEYEFGDVPPPPAPSPPQNYGNTFGPQSQNLASIIRGYKTGVKKHATLNRIDFAWQSRFHDHIIRNDVSFQRISEYIQNNPSNWADDKLYNPIIENKKSRISAGFFVLIFCVFKESTCSLCHAR